MTSSLENAFRRAAAAAAAARPGPGLLASRSFWVGGLVSALVWAALLVVLALLF